MNSRRKIAVATGGAVAVGAMLFSQGTASASTNTYSASSAAVSAEMSTSAEVTPMAIGSLAAKAAGKAAKAVTGAAKKATVYAKAANNSSNRQSLGEVMRAASLSAFGGTSAVKDSGAGIGAEAFDR